MKLSQLAGICIVLAVSMVCANYTFGGTISVGDPENAGGGTTVFIITNAEGVPSE